MSSDAGLSSADPAGDPELDALVKGLETAERETQDVMDQLEDIGLVLLAQERLSDPTPVAQLIPLDELAQQSKRSPD